MKSIRKDLEASMVKLTESGCAQIGKVIAESAESIQTDFGFTYGDYNEAGDCSVEDQEALQGEHEGWAEEYKEIEDLIYGA